MIQVFDNWESQEEFNAFGQTLLPILAELDVELQRADGGQCAQHDPRLMSMWAQLITTRLKPGKGDSLHKVVEQLRAVESPGWGLLPSPAMRDQNDPSKV